MKIGMQARIIDGEFASKVVWKTVCEDEIKYKIFGTDQYLPDDTLVKPLNFMETMEFLDPNNMALSTVIKDFENSLQGAK